MKNILLALFAVACLSISPAVARAQVHYTTLHDIPYRSANDTSGTYARERCKLDLYYPTNLKNFPTIVWFHGGGLTSGNKYIPEQLKNCGYAVVAVNYRYISKSNINACLDDAATAVAWTFHEIGKYGGSTRKIFVSGHSAGGYLTSMIGLDKKWLAAHGVDADSIAGLIPFSGQAITHFAYRATLGMKNTQPLIDAYAPLYYVRADAPPLILITGDRNLEMLGRYEENAYFWRMMKLVGHKETYLYELQGYDHGSMPDAAFHILKAHVKRILAGKE
ncbi:MAG: alpha/beta hydrolase [Tannerella sp.]|jgi:acetyl esterase/lipase|nr:alpha/beta hydrolase [Tannerella sp.]